MEREVLEAWHQNGIEEKGLKVNEGKKRFVFYDGPPFATGLPHYGHILAGTLKDIVPRYWAMKGFYVERRWGWDCHGLPVEFEMEKELNLSGKADVEKYGIANFNESCRAIVQRYATDWEKVIKRTGRWVDFRHDYRTMDTPFMESVWWAFKSLWDKGLVYEGYRVMHYSWRISTPISNFEAGLNYKEVQDPALTVRFKAVGKPYSFLAWTTTPWTLPSNLALAVHPDLDYVHVEDLSSKEELILAEARLSEYFPDHPTIRVIATLKGKSLEGQTYEPLFPYFAKRKDDGAFRVVLGDYVTDTDGTGIVHTAPAFGEDDFEVCKKAGIALVNPVDDEGKFTDEVKDYQGINIKEADKTIIQDLKKQGKILRHDTLTHSYAFCWRSDTPLIYRAISAWFIKVEAIKDQLIKNNQEVHWVPEHLRDGRFGNWLGQARDWNISRNRYWGTPIPIWRCQAKGCGHLLCIGSIGELSRLSGKVLTDIHKHFVDEVTIPCPKCQSTMQRISEVLDCWFESGSMPYAQAHYPFENKEAFEKNFPADFIAEGIDQTRGWFYTLSVLSAALFQKPAFKNVMVNGLVLAEDGKKMSKRLKNYPDPMAVMEAYGADAMRAYLMNSPASHADDLRFSEAGVKEVVRSVLLPLWNSYSFLVTYALADGWSASQFNEKEITSVDNELDQWILSRLHSLIQTIDSKMEVYHLYEVIPSVLGFIDDLTNWYIRLNRRRFWKQGTSADKEIAYGILFYVLREFSKVLAPILPFVTESIYQNLTEGTESPVSVHLCEYPKLNKKLIQTELESEMLLIQNVVSMGRNLRNTHKLKTRQPLKKLLVITRHQTDENTIRRYEGIIQSELNVKAVDFSSDESKWVTLTAKPDAKKIGPRLGARMKEFFPKIKALASAQLALLETTGKVEVGGEAFTSDEIEVVRQPKQAGVIQSSASVTVWIDTDIDAALKQEGLAREVVSRVQKLRKDEGLEVSDRISLEFLSTKEISEAIIAHMPYVSQETLALKISNNSERKSWKTEQDIDGEMISLWIQRV